MPSLTGALVDNYTEHRAETVGDFADGPLGEFLVDGTVVSVAVRPDIFADDPVVGAPWGAVAGSEHRPVVGRAWGPVTGAAYLDVRE